MIHKIKHYMQTQTFEIMVGRDLSFIRSNVNKGDPFQIF